MAQPSASQWWWVNNNPRWRCSRCNRCSQCSQWTSSSRWCISNSSTSNSSRWPWARLLRASSQVWCSNLRPWWCNSQVWCNSSLVWCNNSQVWWCSNSSQVWLWWCKIQTNRYLSEVVPCATGTIAPIQVLNSAWQSFAAKTTAAARWCAKITDPKSALLGTASMGHLSTFARNVSRKLPSAPSSFSCSRLASAYVFASLSPSRSLLALENHHLPEIVTTIRTTTDIWWPFQQHKNY